MDYFGIVKRAWEITLKHKFLWIFGILAGGYSGSRGLNISWPNYTGSNSDTSNLDSAISNMNWTDFWVSYGNIIITILVLFGIFAIIMFILNIVSQGALVGSVEKIDKNEKADFKTGFAVGWHNFWRIWGVSIIFLLMVLASLVVLIVPVAVSIAAQSYVIAVIWGILLFFICLAFWILIGIIYPYSLRVVILEKHSVWESIREALHLFQRNWGEVLVIYLIMMAVGIAYAILLMLAVLIVGGILLAIGYGIWLASSIAAIIYGCVVGLAIIIGLVVISGAYNSFTSSILTLTYLKLSKKN